MRYFLYVLLACALFMALAPMLVVSCAQKVGILVTCDQVPECMAERARRGR